MSKNKADISDLIWPDFSYGIQPNLYTKINLPGIVAGSWGHFNRDTYNNAYISIGSNVSKSIDGNRGFSFNGSQSGSDYLYSGASERCNGATSLLVIVTFKRDTMTGSQQIISEWGSELTNERWLLYSAADGSILFGVQGSIDGSNVLVKSSAAGIISANKWHTIAAYWDAATNSLTAYVDGVNVPITSNIWVFGTVTSLMTPTTSSGLVLGYQYTGVDSKLTGAITIAAVSINVKFGDEKLRSYSANPWQLLDNSNNILYPQFTPTTSTDLLPSLLVNTNTFYTHTISTGSVNLSPSLFANTNTFYTQALSAGVVNLTPSLFTNSNTFYSSIVSQGGVVLQPSLYVNANTFYTQTISYGSVNLTPSLFVNNNAFYTQAVTKGNVDLTPSLFLNSNTFYAHDITYAGSLLPSLFINDNVFYTSNVATGSVELTPGLYTNSNTFYTHTVAATGETTLTPQDLLDIADAVWAHSSAIHFELLLTEAWGRLGLDPTAPLISGQTQISFGSVVMALTQASGNVTATRQ